MNKIIFKKAFLFLLFIVGSVATILYYYGFINNNKKISHVIVISLDTMRADHLGSYGNNWISTPHINKIASESIVFTNYMTVVPTTLASHTTLFTGNYPHTHGTPRNGFMVNQQNLMLPEILKDEGFHTVGIPGSFALDSRFEFNQGFDYYNQDFNIFSNNKDFDQNQRRAESVTDTAISYLEKNGIPRNLFLFVHYFDAHSPYDPPSPFNNMYKNSEEASRWLDKTQLKGDRDADKDAALRYAGEVSYMDQHLGRLMEYLRKKGILDESILIITSDHGENFWDHPAFWDHGWTVYQTTMNAVCIIRLPGASKGGTKVDQLIASIDIMPTLLKHMNITLPENIDGNAVDLTSDEIKFSQRTRFGQATKPWKRVETDPRWYNILKTSCIREDKFKYIFTPYLKTEELYDLTLDPYERKNLLKNPTPEATEQAIRLRSKLEDWFDSANPLPSQFESRKVKESIKRLKSLGYL